MANAKVFISYRRDDTAGHAGRVFDRLSDEFGRDRVFRDIDGIQAGENFVEAIRRNMEAASVVLVLIGPRWLSVARVDGRRRLDDEQDMVRAEILMALEQHKRVIPVLLSGATMPRKDELPPVLHDLVLRNALEIRDTRFDADVADLVDKLDASSGAKAKRAKYRTVAFATALAAFALLLGAWLYPRVALTSDGARQTIVSLGGRYDADSFVEFAGKGDAHMVDIFLRAGMEANATNGDRETALAKASGGGHVEVVKNLVRHGAHPEGGLQPAISKERREVLEFLLAQHPAKDTVSKVLSISPNVDGRMARALLDAGADVNYNRYGTALMTAAYYNSGDVIELLLAKGANANLVNTQRTANGEIALHYALRGGADSTSFTLLLKATTDLEAKDNSGATPLMDAILYGKKHFVGPLLDRGADPKTRRNDGTTTLMTAAMQGDAESMSPLLARGVDVNAQDTTGRTALMYAGTFRGARSAEVVKTLLDHGADPALRDHKGNTAAALARRDHLMEIVSLLERRNRAARP